LALTSAKAEFWLPRHPLPARVFVSEIWHRYPDRNPFPALI